MELGGKRAAVALSPREEVCMISSSSSLSIDSALMSIDSLVRLRLLGLVDADLSIAFLGFLGLRGVDVALLEVPAFPEDDLDWDELMPKCWAPFFLALSRILTRRSVIARAVGTSPLSCAGAALVVTSSWFIDKSMILTPCSRDLFGIYMHIMGLEDLE